MHTVYREQGRLGFLSASTQGEHRMASDKKKATAQKPSAKPFRFGFLVHDVSRMRRTLFDVRMKPLGITRSQWSVLAALSRGGNDGVMQIELARQMDVGKVTIGGLIQRLENIGYVRREDDINDKRARRVFITEKGFDIIHQMESLGSANNARTLMGIDPQALKITEDTLAKVKANIRRELGDAGSGLSKSKK
jgi:MarR family transcriptional regulator, transcriptional regulator for hemolysin